MHLVDLEKKPGDDMHRLVISFFTDLVVYLDLGATRSLTLKLRQMTWKPEKKVRALRTWSKMVVVLGDPFFFFLRWRYSSSRWNFVGGIQTTFKDQDLKRMLNLDYWRFNSF